MAAAAKDDFEWLIHVKESLKKDKTGVSKTDFDACIFGIAHPLLRLKPEAYIPQVISIGPYHHRSLPQYGETDTYKLNMASALEREVRGFKFETLAQHILSLDERIRACYDKHIPYSGEILSWMLALDTSFILHFLKSSYMPYSGNLNTVETESRLMPSNPILHSKRKTPLWYAIKNDILMLENQVPMFLLSEALSLITTHGKAKYILSDTQLGRPRGSEICQGNGRSQENEHLAVILQAACMHFNPLIRDKNSLPLAPALNSTRHVLDYLYHYVTAPSSGPTPVTSQPKDTVARKVFSFLEKKPIKRMISIPRGFIQNGGGILLFIRMFKRMISVTTGGNLPSASQLSEAGIKFASYSSGNLSDISFKRRTSTFLLPKITINDSTEVVLRNLVAWELYSNTTEKPLTRYTYLMDRLIDTERDVAVLKKCDILNSQMGSDAEVAQMWNSMSKSIWENTFDPVEVAIDEANKYYRSKWRVLLAELMKAHCSKPWLVISVFSAGMFLLLTAIQVFWLFYTCNKTHK